MDLLSPEPPPAGVDPSLLEAEDGGDLYEMAAAVTALTQEVRLQGRAFKQVAEAVAPVVERMDAVLERHDALAEASAEERRQRLDEARREGGERLLDTLLDVRDRLLLGRETALAASAPARGWRAWLRRAEDGRTARALLEGYDLALQRLEATLEELQVREIPAVGRPFDPQRMRAVAVEETDRVERGTVVEVFRAGYTLRGTLHRSADVKVARPPAAGEKVSQ